MAKFIELQEFIDRAVKSRKYAENTAYGFKAALKLFESVLNEEERNSVSKFMENLERIYQNVYTKNKNVSAKSLAAYKTRVTKVIHDFEDYGSDASKMASWNPRSRIVQKKAGSASKVSQKTNESDLPEVSENMHRIELALRPDSKVVLVVPRDITANESATIKTILDSLTGSN